ncbi:hypothetical protein SRHO_G00303450 [Serrasalmus rhombeus]
MAAYKNSASNLRKRVQESWPIICSRGISDSSVVMSFETVAHVGIAFLNEYCIAMKPVVKALNILQSETNAHMGRLLPVIFQLQAKLRRMEASSKMRLPVIRAIQDSVPKALVG